jgi:HEAT repeat protein
MTVGGSDNGAGSSHDGALDHDDRVARRRRAVVAGHQGDGPTATALSDDPDPAVRGAALGALGRLGLLDDEHLRRGLRDEEPTVRRRSCALAGRCPGTEVTDSVLQAVVQALSDGEPSVVETAAWALGEFGTRCDGAAVAELVRVAGSHEAPVCRESAVAALGAIGAPETLDVVLGALDDTPNIRRRAAIALAAFDDARAEEGLRRCLADRDWQVRQAAEELLSATETDS